MMRNGDLIEDPICGLNPIDILTSSILRNTMDSDSSNLMMVGNAITTLYRTQPEFYGFLMKCTTAWNKCQKAKLTRMRELSLLSQELQWKKTCTEGLTLPMLQTTEMA